MSCRARVRSGMFVAVLLTINWVIGGPRLPATDPNYHQVVWLVLSVVATVFTGIYFLAGGRGDDVGHS